MSIRVSRLLIAAAISLSPLYASNARAACTALTSGVVQLTRFDNTGAHTVFTQVSGAAPEGILAYDTTNDLLKVCDGTAWQDAATGGSVGADSLDFDDFVDAMALDASTDIATGANTLSISNDGVGTTLRVNNNTSTDTTPFIIDATGKVGVDVLTPNENLEVGGAGRVFIGDGGGASRKGLLIDGDEGTGTYVRLEAYNYAGSTGLPLVINSTGGGNVGIGTTSPTNLLSLGGSAARTIWMERHTTANTAGNNLTVQSGGATSGATDKNGGDLVLSSGTATGTGSSNITFKTAPAGTTGTTDRAPATAMTILGNGNVGIGTTTPAQPLDVLSTVANSGMRVQNTAGPVNVFLTPLDASSWSLIDNTRGQFLIRNSETSGTGYIGFRAGGSSVDQVRISSTGSVGIGTTAPQSLLSVGSGGYAQFEKIAAVAPTATDCDAANEAGRVTYDTTANAWYVCEGATGWVNASGSGGGTPGGSPTHVQFNDGGAFGGDADFVWNKTTNQLTVTGNIASTSATASNTVSASTSLNGGVAQLYLSNTGTGGDNWSLNAGNTATGGGLGANFGIAEASDYRLIIAQGGNVGIGTTAPAATALLDVSSTSKGFLPPRMMTTQRDAITSPATGLMIFNTTNAAFEFYNGTAWSTVGAAMPNGTIAAFASATCPTGWSEYTAARGRFLRGIDPDGTNDTANRAPGNTQTDELKSHTHTIHFPRSSVGSGTLTAILYDNAYPVAQDNTTGITADAVGGTETRPKNVAVTFCQYNGTGGGGGGGGATTLVALSDVTIASPSNGQVLSYNSTSGKWENQAGGGVSADSLDFDDFVDAMTLDASTDIAASGTNVLSITNTGTGNSFVVNDATSDTTPFVVDASGNVGIGIAAPNRLLTVSSTSPSQLQVSNPGTNGASMLFLNSDSGYLSTDGLWIGIDNNETAWIHNYENTAMIFSTNNAQRMTILGSGNVGIGTAAPGQALSVIGNAVIGAADRDASGNAALEVRGTGQIDIYAAGAGLLDFTDGTPVDFDGRIRYDHGVRALQLFTAQTERLRIDNTGNVGIGTTAPNTPLDVAGVISNTDYQLSVRDTAAMAASVGGGITLLGKATSGGGYGRMGGMKAVKENGTTADYTAALTFLTPTSAGNDALTERMRISSAGNVGIGTTSPSARLHVRPTTDVNVEFGAPVAGVIRLEALNDARSAYIDMRFQASPLTFYGNGSENMRVHTNGNVGIGTTSPSFKFVTLGGSTQFGQTTSGAGMRMQTNGTAAEIIGINHDNNAFNALQFTTGASPAMYISTGGNVGIGTTSPAGVLDLGLATNGRGISWGGTSANYSNIFTSYSGGGLVLATGFRSSTSADSYLSSYGGGAIARNGMRLNLAGTEGIQFFTNASATIADGSAHTPTERMRINTAGNVGIGTSNPSYKLTASNDGAEGLEIGPGYVAGGTLIQAYNRNDTTYDDLTYSALTHRLQTSGTERVRIDSAGNVGIGTSSPGAKLHVNGTLTVASTATFSGAGNSTQYYYACLSGTLVLNYGASCAVSDIRYKKNIETLEKDSVFKKLAELRPVEFDWIDEGRGKGRQIGLIAQEVEKVYPSVVSTGSDGYKTVSYQHLVSPLIKAVQELKVENDTLRDELKAMRA